MDCWWIRDECFAKSKVLIELQNSQNGSQKNWNGRFLFIQILLDTEF